MSGELGVKVLSPEQFKEVQKHFQEQAAIKRESLRDKYESNAEVQRCRAMGKDALIREAIERSTKGIKEYNDFKAGRDTSEEVARKQAEGFANKADRDRNH